MERKEMKKRAKGLLALLLAFIMMFGTSLTVFAAGTSYSLRVVNGTASPELQGTTVNAGDHITVSSGGLKVVIDGDIKVNYQDPNNHEYDLPLGGPYKASVSATYDGYNYFFLVNLTTPGNGSATNNTDSKSKKKDSTGTTNTHVHSYSWVTVQEASEGQDGIEQYRCSCGDVQETNVIPATQAVIEEMLAPIRGAKENAHIVFDSGRLYTMSDVIVKELAARNDVSMEITFEYEKTAYKMVIPAGVDYTAILADEDSFYGYFYFAQLVGATIETKE